MKPQESCGNCKHKRLSPYDLPCRHCSRKKLEDGRVIYSKWERREDGISLNLRMVQPK